MTQEVLKLALEFIENSECGTADLEARIKEALAQEQEPVAYDKTEMNCFVQDLYDKKMKEGKHGHYETMFHVVHQAIKRVPPQRTWVGLTAEQMRECNMDGDFMVDRETAKLNVQAKLKELNT